MLHFRSFVHHLGAMAYKLLPILLDVARFLVMCLRPAPALAAENLFLRKQLAPYQARQVKPRRANDATRMALVWLSCFFDVACDFCVAVTTTFRSKYSAIPSYPSKKVGLSHKKLI